MECAAARHESGFIRYIPWRCDMAQTAIKSSHAESKRPFLTEQRRSRITAYTFISPFFILFSIFGLYPIFFTIYLSFFKWDALGPMKYVGLKNYDLVTGDPTFWISFSRSEERRVGKECPV